MTVNTTCIPILQVSQARGRSLNCLPSIALSPFWTFPLCASTAPVACLLTRDNRPKKLHPKLSVRRFLTRTHAPSQSRSRPRDASGPSHRLIQRPTVVQPRAWTSPTPLHTATWAARCIFTRPTTRTLIASTAFRPSSKSAARCLAHPQRPNATPSSHQPPRHSLHSLRWP